MGDNKIDWRTITSRARDVKPIVCDVLALTLSDAIAYFPNHKQRGAWYWIRTKEVMDAVLRAYLSRKNPETFIKASGLPIQDPRNPLGTANFFDKKAGPDAQATMLKNMISGPKILMREKPKKRKKVAIDRRCIDEWVLCVSESPATLAFLRNSAIWQRFDFYDGAEQA